MATRLSFSALDPWLSVPRLLEVWLCLNPITNFSFILLANDVPIYQNKKMCFKSAT